MGLIDVWPKIRAHFRNSFGTTLHVAIASVDQDNNPTTTPIGSLFLNEDTTGFYFEKYTTSLPKNEVQNPNICVLAVNSSRFFWLKSLFKGYFPSYPAMKLYGKLGVKRKATEREIYALKRRMRLTKRLKGHQYLWGKMGYVREVVFTRAEPIKLGKMTPGL